MKDKNAVISPKNDGYKCLQYVVSVALNCEEIPNYPEKVINVETFIRKYNWRRT